MSMLKLTSLFLGLVFATMAQAETFPSRPIRFIVPFPAGGPADVLARSLGERMSAQLKQPIIVENKPGANTIIGADLVAKAPADGYTLLVGTDATYSINPLLYKKLPYAPKTDLSPVAIMAHVPAYLMVRSGLGIRNFRELIAYAKANPGKLTYGSFGNGSNPHLAAEALSKAAGLQMLHVPYKGAAEIVPALLTNQLDLVITSPNQAIPFVAEGKITLLATSSPARLKQFPNVPTYAELGVAGLETNVWFGLLAPSGTPAAVIETLAGRVDEVVASPEFQEKSIRAFALEPPPNGSKTTYFKGVLAADEKRYRQFIQDAGVKPE